MKKLGSILLAALICSITVQSTQARHKGKPKKHHQATESIKTDKLSTYGAVNLKQAKIGELEHKGALSLEASEVQKAEIYGPAILKKTTVTKSLTVYGPLRVYEGALGDVDVKGACDLKKTKVAKLDVMGALAIDETTVNGATSIKGALKADEGTFNKEVVIDGKLRADECVFKGTLTLTPPRQIEFNSKKKRDRPVMVLEDCKAEEILIKGKPEEGKKFLVVLKDETKIKKITFESKEGLIAIYGRSTVDQVIGGEIKDSKKFQKPEKSKQSKKKSRKS